MQESKTIYYKKVGKYITEQTHYFKTEIYPDKEIKLAQITLQVDGWLIIDRFYASDGPSGPTKTISNILFFKRLKAWFLKKFMRAALCHDGTFQCFRSGQLDQKWFHQANKEMRRICEEDGMWRFRVKYTFFAVDKFAHAAASEKNKRKILTAP